MHGATKKGQPTLKTDNNSPTLELEHFYSKHRVIAITPQKRAGRSTNNKKAGDALLHATGKSLLQEKMARPRRMRREPS